MSEETPFRPGPCPACGEEILTERHAAEHYVHGCKTKVFCEKCGVPIPFLKLKIHPEGCIGQTPYVLHNKKAGMVVYLSEEEYTAMQSGEGLEAGLAEAIVQRAVFGVEFETVDLSLDEGDDA